MGITSCEPPELVTLTNGGLWPAFPLVRLFMPGEHFNLYLEIAAPFSSLILPITLHLSL